jgi:DivIVA domain-containing protein
VLVVFVVVAVVVVFAVAAVAVGRGGGLSPVDPDVVRPALPESPMSADDVESLHFAVVFRGYRMDQVDDVLDRLGRELTERDDRIIELESRLTTADSESTPPQ